MKKKSIMKKNTIFIFLLLVMTAFVHAQSTGVIVTKNVRLPSDSAIKMRLISSLNAFLNQKNKADTENLYVAQGRLLETAALLDEMKDVEKSRLYKDDNFFKCYLTNAVRYNDSNFLLQLSYIAVKDSTPILRAGYTLLARGNGDQFNFYTPLELRSGGWKEEKIGNVVFHFKGDLNAAKARAFQKQVSSYDHRLTGTGQSFDFYSCVNFQEALSLIGIDYKADYSGSPFNTLTAHFNNGNVYICGTANEDHFNKVDYHDLWHDRLHSFIAVEKINRPVDEGCAYLYGGSWGLSWQEILSRFKQFAASTPNADWLKLYNDSYNFDPKSKFPLNVDFVINALLVEKIEKEKGFPAVIQLLTCGRRQNGNDNYFQALQQIEGINTSSFNATVSGLIK